MFFVKKHVFSAKGALLFFSKYYIIYYMKPLGRSSIYTMLQGGISMLEQSYYNKADEIIASYEAKPASLIPIMQDIQAEYRYLPAELLSYVAGKIGITEAKAYSVATFYENFSFEAKGKYVIKVCDGTACHVRHSPPVRI